MSATATDECTSIVEISSLGKGLKFLGRTALEFDHQAATRHLALPSVPGDRPENARWAEYLHRAMREGTFNHHLTFIASCIFGGKEYRINGQHTARARLKMAAAYKCPVSQDRWKAESENDLRMLYTQYDRAKARGAGNIIISYLFETPEWVGYTRTTLLKIAEGLGAWLCPRAGKGYVKTPDERAYLLMTDHYELAIKVGQLLSEEAVSESKHILRSPVIGAMFATYNKAAGPAREFWQTVRDGMGVQNKTDPRRVLREGLIRASINLGRGAAKKKSVGPEEMHRWCLNAWNTWRRGDPLKILKAVLAGERPKII